MKEAIEKIQNEVNQNPNHPYVKFIGEYLINHLSSNPGDAPKITQADKTIINSLDAMQKEAAKYKFGIVGVLTPQQGYDIVSKYFGLTGSGAVPVEAVKELPADDFDVKLDDFLE